MRQELLSKYEEVLSTLLTRAQIRKLFDRLERVSCKISPLNPNTGNTKTKFRWELGNQNYHYASQEECKAIFDKLINNFLSFCNAQGYQNAKYITFTSDSTINKELLIDMLAQNSRIGLLEIPIWYKKNISNGGLHQAQNIFWLTPVTELVKLRNSIVGNIVTKIQVKSYLTDRRQTGEYKTNREIRWETHPESPQYATRLDCMHIEMKLLAQIFTFRGAPEIPDNLKRIVEKALSEPYKKDSFRCPLSGKSIYYSDFLEKAINPTHGRSDYQVGHLIPLASTGLHNVDNTSWITELGNRVQGENSLNETTNNIFFMANFHKERLNKTWPEIEDIAKSNDY